MRLNYRVGRGGSVSLCVKFIEVDVGSRYGDVGVSYGSGGVAGLG